MEFRKNRIVFDYDEIKIPGLTLFGHNISHKATQPLTTHIHKNCYEFVLVVKGEEVYYVDGQNHTLTGMHLFVSFPDQEHKNGTAYQGMSEIYWFQIDISESESFLGLSEHFQQIVREKLASLTEHSYPANARTVQLTKQVFQALMQNREPIVIQGLFIHLLTKLLYFNNANETDCRIKTVLDYIDAHLYENLSMDQLSGTASLSVSAFKHNFKETMGKSPREYINYKRIEEAKHLLSTGKSITQTAMLLNFNTTDYFSTVFKRYTLNSPTQFIKSLSER